MRFCQLFSLSTLPLICFQKTVHQTSSPITCVGFYIHSHDSPGRPLCFPLILSLIRPATILICRRRLRLPPSVVRAGIQRAARAHAALTAKCRLPNPVLAARRCVSCSMERAREVTWPPLLPSSSLPLAQVKGTGEILSFSSSPSHKYHRNMVDPCRHACVVGCVARLRHNTLSLYRAFATSA